MDTTINHEELVAYSTYALLEQQRSAFWVRSVDFKRFIYISAHSQHLWPRRNVDQQHTPCWLDVVHPEDATVVRETINQHLIAVTPETAFSLHYRVQTDAMKTIVIKEHVVAVFHLGQFIAFASLATPNPSAAQTTNELDDPMIIGNVLRKFAEKSRDVFWIRNADYDKQIFVSPSFEEIWGRASDVLFTDGSAHDTWKAFLHPDDRERLLQDLNQRTAHVKPSAAFLYEYRLVRPNGEIRWIRDESFPIYDDGKHIGFAGIAQDISNEKELEASRELAKVASQSKSDFLANMSHDLRTPLNWLLGAAEILKKRNQNKDDEKLFEMIVDGGRRIQHMIEEILDYAKLESGKSPVYEEPFNLRHTIEEIIGMFADEARKKAINLVVDYPDEIPRHIVGDQQRTRRIVLNLVSNAIKFTQHGHVHITVDCLLLSGQHTQLEISVSDSGIGIPDNRLSSIFERFEKIEPSYQSQHKGIGLGLAIVKKFVDGMGGTICVTSSLGQGSTFQCQLPFATQAKSNPPTSARKLLQNARIVIIDSSTTGAHAIRHTIGAKQCTIIRADKLSGWLKNHTTDIILLNGQHDTTDWIHHWHAWVEYTYPQPLFVLYDDLDENGRLKHILPITNTLALAKPLLPTELLSRLSHAWVSFQLTRMPATAVIVAYRPRILLVEDEPFGQKIVRILLEEEFGCRVDIAENGRCAHDQIEKHNYDLILMDIGLPGDDGLLVTQQIRSLEDYNERIPIVALTAHASDDVIARCSEVGMQNHLSKPTSPKELLEIIVEHVLRLH